MKGKALIIGSAGQDGHYLAEFLSQRGYRVAGADRTDRKESSPVLDDYWRCDLRDSSLIAPIIDQTLPSEIYYLAAQNFSSGDERALTAPVAEVFEVNLVGAAATLSTISDRLPHCRFFYAGSCHVFGEPTLAPQNEATPHNPTTPYGISKSAGLGLCRYFRESHGVFAVGGILFNHESPLRRPPFISARLARAAALVSVGKGQKISVHDTEAVVDWGAASDFVEAMWLALTHSVPDDYVIATGTPHTVREFADTAFNYVGARWEDWVVSDASRPPTRSAPYVGDSTLITRVTGWKPRTPFSTLVQNMVEAHAKAAE